MVGDCDLCLRNLDIHHEIILEQHNGILYCTVPFSNSSNKHRSNLAHIFDLFHKKKEEKSIESYSITQTTLEQIFIHLAGEDQYVNTDEMKPNLSQ